MGQLAAISPRDLYLDLLKKQLTGMIYEDPPLVDYAIHGFLLNQYSRKIREWGRDHPSQAHTMIGLRRLSHIQWCVEQILAENVPGDLIETGVWRGGATILMRGVLAAYEIADRLVWVADSFEGLPVPDTERYPLDAYWSPIQESSSHLAVSLEEVRRNFALYQLLDDQVRFLPGWFSATLPAAPIRQLALLRFDGDLYGSAMDVFNALYDKIAPGGFVIVDDYNLPTCKAAVDDFRGAHSIDEAIHDIDGVAAYWRRGA
jgi:hypothetical protein